MTNRLCACRAPGFSAVLITGASSGIGSAFATAMPETTDLLLTGRDAERLEALRAQLARPGRRVELVRADLATSDGCDTVVNAAEAFQIDLLVNNAGSGRFGPVLDNPSGVERATVAVDVVAVTELTRRLLPGMIARAGAAGRRAGLINLASSLGFQPLPHLATYAASKAFVLSYTEALAAELASAPIDVVALCPGATRTAFGARAGFRMGNLPGAVSPERVAREGLAALGRRPVHVVGPVSRAVLGPRVAARRLATDALGLGMRLVGARLRAAPGTA